MSGLMEEFTKKIVCNARIQDHLYENLELGVDLDSRIALVGWRWLEPELLLFYFVLDL